MCVATVAVSKPVTAAAVHCCETVALGQEVVGQTGWTGLTGPAAGHHWLCLGEPLVLH